MVSISQPCQRNIVMRQTVCPLHCLECRKCSGGRLEAPIRPQITPRDKMTSNIVLRPRQMLSFVMTPSVASTSKVRFVLQAICFCDIFRMMLKYGHITKL